VKDTLFFLQIGLHYRLGIQFFGFKLLYGLVFCCKWATKILVFDLGYAAYWLLFIGPPPQAPPVPPLLALLSAYYIRSQGGGWAAMHIVFCCFCCSYLCSVVQVSVGNPHPVVLVLGSCFSRQGSPPLLLQVLVKCAVVSVHASMAQRGLPPRCFGSG